MITGDFAKLRELKDKFRAASTSGFKQRLAKQLGAEALKLVADGFRDEQDPYGLDWKPLAAPRGRQGRKKRGDKILDDKGLLKRSFSIEASSEGFKLGSDRKYSIYHQKGATFPQRTEKRTLYHGHVTASGARGGRGFTKRGARAWSSKRVQVTFGEHSMPRRRMVPDARALGVKWRTAFEAVSRKFMDEHFNSVPPTTKTGGR